MGARAGLRRPRRRRAPPHRPRRLAPRRAVRDGNRAPARAHARAGRRRAGSVCSRPRVPSSSRSSSSTTAPPLAAPETAPDLEAAGTRLWRVEDDGRRAGVLRGSQLLIADGHHRYETALQFAVEDGADRMMVVLVSTSDPGLEIFATHRVFAGRDGHRPRGRAVPDRRGRARRARATSRRRAPRRSSSARLDAARARGAGRARRRARRPARPRGDLVHARPREAVRRVECGRRDCALLLRPTRIEDVFERARRGEVLPPEDHLLLPEAPLRPALPSGRPVTSTGSTFCRACVADLDGVLAELPTRVEREPVLRAGEGGDDTTAIDAAAEDAVVRRPRGARRRPDARLRGARRPRLRARRPAQGRRRSDRRVGQREARDPVLLALARRRGRPDDGRRRSSATSTTSAPARNGSRSAASARRSTASPLDAPGPKDRDRDPLARGDDDRCDRGRRAGMRGVAHRVRVMGSLALSLCHLAAGRVDAVCCLKPARSIDIAAAQLLVRERGLAIELFEDPPFGDGPARPRPALPGRRGRERCSVRALAAVLAAALTTPVLQQHERCERSHSRERTFSDQRCQPRPLRASSSATRRFGATIR